MLLWIGVWMMMLWTRGVDAAMDGVWMMLPWTGDVDDAAVDLDVDAAVNRGVDDAAMNRDVDAAMDLGVVLPWTGCGCCCVHGCTNLILFVTEEYE